jgi:hypothetical protein
MPERDTWTIRYGGAEYTLRLRLADDGYVTGYQRAAVAQIIGEHTDRYGRPVSIFADPARADRFFTLACRIPEHRGAPVEAVPWETWLELDADVLGQIVDRFFLSLLPRLERSNASEADTALATALRAAYPLTMQTPSTSTSRRHTEAPAIVTMHSGA